MSTSSFKGNDPTNGALKIVIFSPRGAKPCEADHQPAPRPFSSNQNHDTEVSIPLRSQAWRPTVAGDGDGERVAHGPCRPGENGRDGC